MENLEIGINTYCSLDEANDIISANYPIGDNCHYWNALTDEQKGGLLIKSTMEMERLPVAGVKVFYNQPLQFPRKSNFYKFNTIPDEIKHAQVINCMDMLLITLGLKKADGKVLTSLDAEKRLNKWTSGGFKMAGVIW